MSIIHAACCEAISQLKKWKYMSIDAQQVCFQHVYQLFARPFLEALTYVQENREDISILQSPLYVFICFPDHKQIMFYSQSNQITGFQCTCQKSWERKKTQNLYLVCKHQIAYILLKHCFNQSLKCQKVEGINQLSQLLGKLKY